MLVAVRERGFEPGLLLVDGVLPARGEDVANPLEWAALAIAVVEGILLDPAADLVDRGGAERNDVEYVEHRDRVVESLLYPTNEPSVAMSPGDGTARQLLQPVGIGLRGSRSGRRTSSRARTWPHASRVRSTIPVSSFGPRPSLSMDLVDT